MGQSIALVFKPTDDTTETTTIMLPPSRSAAAGSPLRLHPLATPSPRPLLVQLRLPRDDAASTNALVAEHAPQKGGFATKRSRSQRGSSESGSSDGDSASSDPRRSRPAAASEGATKKTRRPTYTVRKEETQVLLQQLTELHSAAEQLRSRIGLPSLEENRSLEARQQENARLDDRRREQLLTLCEGQALLSQYMRDRFSGPIKIPIVLGKDLAQRRTTLLELRPQKLEIARRYLNKRFVGVNERAPFSDYQTWTSAAGDICFHRADVTHFKGVGSLQHVFDALFFYMSNMEISISEELGQLTLREDIDAVGTSISNHRIVSSIDDGVVVEVNIVNCAEFDETISDESGGEMRAVMTNDSVDVDELYPYCPESRVQRTINAMVGLSSYRAPSQTGAGDELVVVMRRCAYLAIKKPQFSISDKALDVLRASIDSWGNVMIKTISERARTLALCRPLE